MNTSTQTDVHPRRTVRSTRRKLLWRARAAVPVILIGGVLTAGIAIQPAGAALSPTVHTHTASTNPTVMAATYLKQWMLDPNHNHHPLYAKTAFSGPADRNSNLKNSRTHKFLQWEHQTFGVNLGWTDNASPQTANRVSRWFFTRPSNDKSPLRYGEPLALGYGSEPSYIHYAHRTVGINIDWSQSPKFEWKLLGGAAGQPVRSGDWLAIYNQKTNDCLIYFDRTVGGDIGWPSSQTWSDQIKDVVLQAIKDHWKEGVAYLLAS